jgi:hypothetical protein
VTEFAAGAAGQLPGRSGLDRIQVTLVGRRGLLQVHQLAVGECLVVGAAGTVPGHRTGGGQERVCEGFHNTYFLTIATLFEKKVLNVDNFLRNTPEEGSVSLRHKATATMVVVT